MPSSSSPAVTVTVWSVFQSEVVNVSEESSTVRPVAGVTVTVTSPVGCVASFTLSSPVPPSVTASVLATVSAGSSSSVTVTATVSLSTSP